MAKLTDPAERNRVAEEHGNFENSATGSGVQQFGGDVDNNWLIVGGILALIFFS